MIVYAGKQFWNDFNNWDEWVFQDAGRPRDDDKFRIRPWMQSEKWDWRGANKNTSLCQLIIKWGSTVPWTSDWTSLKWAIPVLKPSWTANDLSNIGFPWATSELLEWLKEDRYGNPYVALREWNITYETAWSTATKSWQYMEILESWLYVVQVTWQFVFPSSYSSSTSYQYKYRVGITAEINWVFTPIAFQWFRCCGNGDAQNYIHIAWMEKWTKLTSIAAHTYTSGTTFVFQNMNFIRLW